MINEYLIAILFDRNSNNFENFTIDSLLFPIIQKYETLGVSTDIFPFHISLMSNIFLDDEKENDKRVLGEMKHLLSSVVKPVQSFKVGFSGVSDFDSKLICLNVKQTEKLNNLVIDINNSILSISDFPKDSEIIDGKSDLSISLVYKDRDYLKEKSVVEFDKCLTELKTSFNEKKFPDFFWAHGLFLMKKEEGEWFPYRKYSFCL